MTHGSENQQSAPPATASDRSRRVAIDRRRLLIDAAVGGGLVVALAIVFALDRGSSSSDGEAPSAATSTVEVASGESVGTSSGSLRALRLAVTPPEYDDMGKLLDALGPGYRYTEISFDDLLEADRLVPFDVVFLTCGGVPRAWLDRQLRESERRGAGVFRAKPGILRQIRESFRTFVGRGGTLYASDWQFDLVSSAFPDLIDQPRVGKGEVQTIEAEVTDAGLRRLLGPAIDLSFDLPGWRPAAFRGAEVTTYLRGTYRLRDDGAEQTGPLLVTFPHGEGTVVFTSFHNEAQNTQIEQELLRHLVFTSVTAREQGRIRKTMVRGGFSPTERNLLSASAGAKPVRQTYACQERGPLQFVLGFEDRGAKLRLAVAGPGGDKIEKTGTQTFNINVDDAVPGVWQYTVTPVKIPYENFPFTLTIGEKR